MCNYLNTYTNLNDAHYIRYTYFKKNVQKMHSLFVWYIFKTVQQLNKMSLWFQSIPLSKYPYKIG